MLTTPMDMHVGNDSDDSCRNAGFEDGRNGPFYDATYDHCGDEATGDQAYLDGFIDGLYVDRRQH